MSAAHWAAGYESRQEGDVPGTFLANYRLSVLVSRGLIAPEAAQIVLNSTGMHDYFWQLTWQDETHTQDAQIAERVSAAQGVVIFLHGWTGNHTIWESLPGLVCAINKRLISIAFDHNGFGASSFTDTTPSLDHCNPPAAMRAIELLIDLLGLRVPVESDLPRVINFVGHSMGGAMLFYLNPKLWQPGEETRLSIAPALLLEDEVKKVFYTTLGVGISIVNRLGIFELIERALKPGIIEALCAGASNFVKNAHKDQYQQTPRGITAATFTAMGLLNNREIPRRFDFMRVMLGHRDSLVGLVPMIDLLGGLEFPAGQLRVVAGSHYLFSVGADSVYQHAQNRELIVQDIVELHEKAFTQQRFTHLNSGSRSR
jgi:pimeloyl-ACP methyl ester carboxylesterase